MTLNVPKPSFQGYAYAIFYVEISQAMAWWPDLWLYPKSGTAKVFPQPSFVWITQFTTEIGSWILLLVWGKNKRPPYIGILLPISISTISIRMLFHQNRATRWGRGSNDVIDFLQNSNGPKHECLVLWIWGVSYLFHTCWAKCYKLVYAYGVVFISLKRRTSQTIC